MKVTWCESGRCINEAVYQTYFLGGPFMKLCAHCEHQIFGHQDSFRSRFGLPDKDYRFKDIPMAMVLVGKQTV